MNPRHRRLARRNRKTRWLADAFLANLRLLHKRRLISDADKLVRALDVLPGQPTGKPLGVGMFIGFDRTARRRLVENAIRKLPRGRSWSHRHPTAEQDLPALIARGARLS